MNWWQRRLERGLGEQAQANDWNLSEPNATSVHNSSSPVSSPEVLYTVGIPIQSQEFLPFNTVIQYNYSAVGEVTSDMKLNI
jgi:hypothetical protein